ncbi:hypothetical protein LZ198_28645 [Myxococcus sp. K15C18031901]|uniref:hypothetical protein n=1 Tax=Myxococcus dinghuensis TaxID=2906761 RepID=UPI0020A6DBB9|nr:hypothetical protein [Myxococcus dinghuensis]MCP3102853.1 hypothetical protein [Myxococcus dinghuensis]
MTLRLWKTLSVVATLGFTGAALAQEAPETQAQPVSTSEPVDVDVRAAHISGPQVAIGVNIGLGAGYVYKHGTSRTTGAPENLKITDAADVSIPLLVELGYRINPRFYVGVWGTWEKVFTKTNDISCPENFDCNNSQWRFGPEGRFHFLPTSRFDPWVGLAVGLEILKSHVKGDTQVALPNGATAPARFDSSVTDRGPTFARLSIGGDYRLARFFAVGPMLTASIGSYTVRTGDQTLTIDGIPPQTSQVSAVKDGFHGLFTLGVRGVFHTF